jgi:hypothetical protein
MLCNVKVIKNLKGMQAHHDGQPYPLWKCNKCCEFTRENIIKEEQFFNTYQDGKFKIYSHYTTFGECGLRINQWFYY